MGKEDPSLEAETHILTTNQNNTETQGSSLRLRLERETGEPLQHSRRASGHHSPQSNCLPLEGEGHQCL